MSQCYRLCGSAHHDTVPSLPPQQGIALRDSVDKISGTRTMSAHCHPGRKLWIQHDGPRGERTPVPGHLSVYGKGNCAGWRDRGRRGEMPARQAPGCAAVHYREGGRRRRRGSGENARWPWRDGGRTGWRRYGGRRKSRPPSARLSPAQSGSVRFSPVQFGSAMLRCSAPFPPGPSCPALPSPAQLCPVLPNPA